MELRITTKMEPGTLPEIQWNSSELKEEIQKKAQEYIQCCIHLSKWKSCDV